MGVSLGVPLFLPLSLSLSLCLSLSLSLTLSDSLPLSLTLSLSLSNSFSFPNSTLREGATPTPVTDDAVLAVLRRANGQMTRLDLSNCPLLTDACLSTLKDHRDLVFLSVKDCPLITVEGVSNALSHHERPRATETTEEEAPVSTAQVASTSSASSSSPHTESTPQLIDPPQAGLPYKGLCVNLEGIATKPLRRGAVGKRESAASLRSLRLKAKTTLAQCANMCGGTAKCTECVGCGDLICRECISRPSLRLVQGNAPAAMVHPRPFDWRMTCECQEIGVCTKCAQMLLHAAPNGAVNLHAAMALIVGVVPPFDRSAPHDTLPPWAPALMERTFCCVECHRTGCQSESDQGCAAVAGISFLPWAVCNHCDSQRCFECEYNHQGHVQERIATSNCEECGYGHCLTCYLDGPPGREPEGLKSLATCGVCERDLCSDHFSPEALAKACEVCDAIVCDACVDEGRDRDADECAYCGQVQGE